MYSILGKSILNKIYYNVDNIVFNSEFNQGIYLLNIIIDGKYKSVHKVIKN